MVIDYSTKAQVMDIIFKDYKNTRRSYMTRYKGIPVDIINEYKKFIDFTRFYIMYRGPRKGRGNCTLKKDAIKADIYEYNQYSINEKRLMRENYLDYLNNNR